VLEKLAAEVYTPARASVPPAVAAAPKTGMRNHITRVQRQLLQDADVRLVRIKFPKTLYPRHFTTQ